MDNKNKNQNYKKKSLKKIVSKPEIKKLDDNFKKENYYSENNHYIYNKYINRNNDILDDKYKKISVKNKLSKNKKLGIDVMNNKQKITNKKLRNIRSNEVISNMNNFFKFNDFHSNIIDRLEKNKIKQNNQNNYHKGKCFNNININQNNDINKFRPHSDYNKGNNQKLKNKINFNKDRIINSSHSKNKKIPHLINIDLTKIDQKEVKNNKNFQKKKLNIPLNNKSHINHSSKNKIIPSININLDDINKDQNINNKKRISDKNNIINVSKNNNIINNNSEQNNEIIKKNDLYISYAFVENQNKNCRDYMEDFHDFKNLSFNNFICYYFSIFDGHNGKEVSLYLKNNFHKILFNELKLISFTKNWKLNNEKIISSIKISFEKMDKNIINNKDIKDDIGSTGTILLLYKDPYDNSKKILVSANVGDSKGILINKNEINQITKAHICSDLNEVERIKKEGGVVFRGRVFGTLILTRSFGDKEMKKYGVMSIPYCLSSLINENDLYVIIGSDGVWDVISNEDLFKFSKEKISSEDFAKKIVNLSIDKGTTDNASCLVLKLN